MSLYRCASKPGLCTDTYIADPSHALSQAESGGLQARLTSQLWKRRALLMSSLLKKLLFECLENLLASYTKEFVLPTRWEALLSEFIGLRLSTMQIRSSTPAGSHPSGHEVEKLLSSAISSIVEMHRTLLTYGMPCKSVESIN
jgi:hypothetical protein